MARAKQNLVVTNIYSADSARVVQRLKEKLEVKRKKRLAEKGEKLRRSQVSLSKGDLTIVGAVEIKVK